MFWIYNRLLINNGLLICYGVAEDSGYNNNLRAINLPLSYSSLGFTALITQRSATIQSKGNIAAYAVNINTFNIFSQSLERQQGIFWITIGY